MHRFTWSIALGASCLLACGELSGPVASASRSSGEKEGGRDEEEERRDGEEEDRDEEEEHLPIGSEQAVPHRLQEGEEHEVGLKALIDHGETLFRARWTVQDGAGRPLTTGAGEALADRSRRLEFPFNFNRLSAPDATSCESCHNVPFLGGGGDFAANAFVLAQRFDFITFDPLDSYPRRGSVQENGERGSMETVGNFRNAPSLFGAGYIELLAREISLDLQAQRDALVPGDAIALASKGISFGTLRRGADGAYDTSKVYGLPPMSLGAQPTLIVHPFHQAGALSSIRQFVNGAFNQHVGIQTVERFGHGSDPDEDGFANEMGRAEVTAVTIFIATMQVPGRVIPRHRAVEEAVRNGEVLFSDIGCARCHVPRLPLYSWQFKEPGPFNPPGNLQAGQTETLSVDLSGRDLPKPRLRARRGVVQVPAFTDLRLHDITCGPGDPNAEPLDMHFSPEDPEFFGGNRRFLTRKLWGIASEPPFYHHGKYSTLRESILAHCGAALDAREAFESLGDYDQGSIIEFLKTLRALPRGTRSRILDEHGHRRRWETSF